MEENMMPIGEAVKKYSGRMNDSDASAATTLYKAMADHLLQD